jgi:thiamine-phosphate pyrophosphorylase
MEELYSKVLLSFGQKTLKILKALKKSSTTELICAHLRLKENGLQNLKQNKINKKFVYLISPNKIESNEFYADLDRVLSSKKISFFQLRLKNEISTNKIYIGKKIKKICKKHKVKFLVNDDPILAKKLNADGCHLGQKDMSIKKARKILKNKIIGVTCHNSINLAKKAIKDGANYLAFGAFYSSRTKKIKYKADLKILNLAKKITNIPIVAIGGIKLSNYKKLLLNKANFLAISGYIWNNKKYKPLEAIRKLK